MKLAELSFAQLVRLRERWQKAKLNEKDKDKADMRRARAVNAIDSHIMARQTVDWHCALPKKKRRQMGLLPPVGIAS